MRVVPADFRDLMVMHLQREKGGVEFHPADGGAARAFLDMGSAAERVLPVLPLNSRARRFVPLVAVVLAAGCTKSIQPTPDGGGSGTPPYDPLTGVWVGTVDAGSRAAKLRFTLVDDAGTLFGFKAINDPEEPDKFVTLDRFNGTRRGNDVVLQASTETITATLDGGRLIGVDPLTEPTEGLDAGQQPASVNLYFEMVRTTTTVVLPDAGEFPPPELRQPREK